MHPPEMAHAIPSRRARAKIPGWWVTALLQHLTKNEDDASHDASVSVSTVYRWQAKGIDFLDWRGVLSIYDLPNNWKPPKPEAYYAAIAAASPRRGRPPADAEPHKTDGGPAPKKPGKR